MIVAPVLQPQQLYADLNTASPQNKRDVAAIIEGDFMSDRLTP